MSVNAYTTQRGDRIVVGQLYRDAKGATIRTLRVDRIDPDPDSLGADIHFTVIEAKTGDKVTTPMRTNSMTAHHLTGRDFNLITESAR
ncbi:hypothetical protein GV792_04845 [Nocardia cyriacigeorgica]|uniref:hypothetical protein n=1 Tax=Nocardia cyriacigeorgica TaxID=135487 RepID=UPI0013B86D6E|nr:hypothetical protein [Nocardia cyriacigeorgica]NEW49371.1 hypothetical protein [Nocardia cyriacigeorgica]